MKRTIPLLLSAALASSYSQANDSVELQTLIHAAQQEGPITI